MKVYSKEKNVTFYKHKDFDRYIITLDSLVRDGRVFAIEFKTLSEYLPQEVHLTALPKYYKAIKYTNLSRELKRKLCLVLKQQGDDEPLNKYNLKENQNETV